MSDCVFCRLLDWPLLYRLSQTLLAPGAEKNVTRKIRDCISRLPPAQCVLDVGCGPASWLWRVGVYPVGLDLTADYTKAFRRQGHSVITGSAAALPFRDGSFDGIWSIGLLHHLTDNVARQAVREMLRVCRPGGYLVVFDAVLPEPAWQRPLAYALRKMDRGGYVRQQVHLTSLLPTDHPWTVERFVYASTGLEMLGCYVTRESSRT